MNREQVACLDPVLQEVQTMELTQQVKLTDAMPDIGRILASWGQVILRGKEWLDGEAVLNGGMLVWVLYVPEDGSPERCIDSWIPFKMKWDLPEEIDDGILRLRCLTRFVDGRSISPRKIMVRCGVSVLAEGFVPMEQEICMPPEESEEVELLESTYPLRIGKEAGEKVFALDEDLTLPDSAPHPEKLICCRMEPRIADCRVLGDKLAFRGCGNLHILYRSDEGQLHGWDFPLEFSQVAELEREYGSDPQADLVPAVTGLEVEIDEEGHIRLKCGLTAQYRITDRQMVTLVEDAYSPCRELRLEMKELELPVILEQRRDTISIRQIIPAEADVVADVIFLPDFPGYSLGEGRMELEYPGSCQVLYYGTDGALHGANARWEGRQMLKTDEQSHILSVPVPAEPSVMTGSGQIQMTAEMPVDMTAMVRQRIPMVAAVEMGQARQTDPERPALILRRAGSQRLWDIAKDSGSRVEDIRRANGLRGEPAPEQMLLIPVR